MRLDQRCSRVLLVVVAIMSAMSMLAVAGPSAHAAEDYGQNRDAAISLGEVGDVGDYEISVVSVEANANQIVASGSPLNELPAEDHQFAIARISVTYTGTNTITPSVALNVQAVGVMNVAYTTFNDSCGLIPDDNTLAPVLYGGDTIEFNVCWEIQSEDASSLVMYVEPLLSVGSAPLWFSLGNASLASSSAPSVAPVVIDASSLDAPILVGAAGGVGDYTVTVSSIEPIADELIAAENKFNNPAVSGTQFFMTHVSVTYTGSEMGNPGDDLSFGAVGQYGYGYTTTDNTCGVTPDGDSHVSDLFTGGATDFNVCWQIDSADADSLVMYVEPTSVEAVMTFAANPAWFSLDSSTAISGTDAD